MTTKIAPDFDYTDAELLALVKEAIAVVTKYGKSYVIGGRTFTRENISDLYDLLPTALNCGSGKSECDGGFATPSYAGGLGSRRAWLS